MAINGISPTFRLEWLCKGWRRFRRWTGVRPVFGSPSQRASSSAQTSLSWWHIPISLQPGYFGLGCAEIPDCYILLIRLWELRRDGQSFPAPGKGIKLRWETAERTYVERRTLRYGEGSWVPIVKRDEADHESTLITGGAYFHTDEKKKWALSKGRWPFHLEVRVGDKVWRSEEKYVINVPDESVTNGRFSLELELPSIRWRGGNT